MSPPPSTPPSTPQLSPPPPPPGAPPGPPWPAAPPIANEDVFVNINGCEDASADGCDDPAEDPLERYRTIVWVDVPTTLHFAGNFTFRDPVATFAYWAMEGGTCNLESYPPSRSGFLTGAMTMDVKLYTSGNYSLCIRDSVSGSMTAHPHIILTALARSPPAPPAAPPPAAPPPCVDSGLITGASCATFELSGTCTCDISSIIGKNCKSSCGCCTSPPPPRPPYRPPPPPRPPLSPPFPPTDPPPPRPPPSPLTPGQYIGARNFTFIERYATTEFDLDSGSLEERVAQYLAALAEIVGADAVDSAVVTVVAGDKVHTTSRRLESIAPTECGCEYTPLTISIVLVEPIDLSQIEQLVDAVPTSVSTASADENSENGSVFICGAVETTVPVVEVVQQHKHVSPDTSIRPVIWTSMVAIAAVAAAAACCCLAKAATILRESDCKRAQERDGRAKYEPAVLWRHDFFAE